MNLTGAALVWGQQIAWTQLENWSGVAAGAIIALLLSVLLVVLRRNRHVQAQVEQRLLDDIRAMSRENAAQRGQFTSMGTKFGYFPYIFERVTPPDLYRARYTSDGVPLAREKRVDVQLCADLMADAIFDMYDVAVLASCDSDFIPAIDFVRQEMHKHVVQVGHPHFSETIRKSCSGHINLTDVVARAAADAAPA